MLEIHSFVVLTIEQHPANLVLSSIWYYLIVSVGPLSSHPIYHCSIKSYLQSSLTLFLVWLSCNSFLIIIICYSTFICYIVHFICSSQEFSGVLYFFLFYLSKLYEIFSLPFQNPYIQMVTSLILSIGHPWWDLKVAKVNLLKKLRLRSEL